MTTPLHVCRACDGVITDPADAVHLGDEETEAGPWRPVWAHRAHVDDVLLMPPGLAEIMLRLWAAGS
jgi:hypothetical protein